MRKGGSNPWAVDYSEEIHKAQAPVQEEKLLDKATKGAREETLVDKAKSFSF